MSAVRKILFIVALITGAALLSSPALAQTASAQTVPGQSTSGSVNYYYRYHFSAGTTYILISVATILAASGIILAEPRLRSMIPGKIASASLPRPYGLRPASLFILGLLLLTAGMIISGDLNLKNDISGLGSAFNSIGTNLNL